MKKKQRQISLTTMIAIGVVIAAILSVGLYFFVIRTNINKVFFEEAYEENEEIAQSAVDFFESKIYEEINTLISIEVAHHNILGQQDIVFDNAYYETIASNSEYITEIEVLNLNKDIIYSSKTTQNRIGINISDYYLFQSLEGEHELSIGNLIYDTINNELALEVAYSGEEVIVYGLISIEFFQLYGEDFKDSFDNKELMILAGNGKYLYDSYSSQHLIQNVYTDFDELIETIDLDSLSTYTINDQDSVVSMKLMGINDWRIIVYESRSSALYTNQITGNYYTLTTIGIIVLLLAMFGYIAHLIMIDVKTIVHRLEDVAEGDFGDDLDSSTIQELNVLRHGFNTMKNNIRSSTKRLEYLAYHDALTELPTLNKAVEDFEGYMSHDSIAFVYIDINRFEIINDNYGYAFGDEVLKHTTLLMDQYFDQLYRVQSDEFLGFIFDTTKEQVFTQLEFFIRDIESGIIINDVLIPISVKMGLARYPSHGSTFDELIQKAIISTHEAKSKENVGFLCFDDSKSDYYLRQSRIELLLTKALEQNEFTTVYQPIINIKDDSIRGFEALSRWNNSELGVVRPDEFIPLLERIHKVSVLDEFVLNNSLRLNKFLQDEYNLHLISSVNVSVETIMRVEFTDIIDNALERFQIQPKYLEIEITESTIIHDFDGIQKKIQYLRSKGVKFSEDDFGDAYSSLTYLTRLDIDTLKISKNFLSSILTNVESRILVQTIIDLAHRLGFFTVVEGIEDESTYNLFKEYNCDYVQGYYCYRPKTEEALLKLLKEKAKEKE